MSQVGDARCHALIRRRDTTLCSNQFSTFEFISRLRVGGGTCPSLIINEN